MVLWVVIGPYGHAHEIRVARPLGMGLDEKAVEAVRTWRFEPAHLGGQAVAVAMNVEVSFRLYCSSEYRGPNVRRQTYRNNLKEFSNSDFSRRREYRMSGPGFLSASRQPSRCAKRDARLASLGMTNEWGFLPQKFSLRFFSAATSATRSASLSGSETHEGRKNIPVPVAERYFEDYVPGSVFEYGSIALSKDEIVEFARSFDPQFIHIDPIAAAKGPFGGLIASGWHTASVMMRLFVDHYLSHVASMASPGVDEVRWMRPVRPGDCLSIRVSILEANRSRSKPDRGMVRTAVEALNQNQEVVMSLKAMNILRCREAS